MKKNLLSNLLLVFMLVLFSFAATTVSSAQCRLLNETFTDPPVLSPSNVNNAWYPDRYPPAGFSKSMIGTQSVLDVFINGSTDGLNSRPAGKQTRYYNYQGRKFNQCTGDVISYEGDIYIPTDFITKHRQTGLWAVAYDFNNQIYAYPEIGFRNLDGKSPQFYYWDGNSSFKKLDVYVEAGVWYHLGMKVANNKIDYYLNGKKFGSIITNTSLKRLGQVMVNSYNFNDPTLPADTRSSDSYHSYYDNLKTTSATSARGVEPTVQETHKLIIKNYPNPFAGITTIEYNVPIEGRVSLKVYDVLGRPVSTLVDGNKGVGNYKVNFDGSKVSKGNYYYKVILETKDNNQLMQIGNMNIER